MIDFMQRGDVAAEISEPPETAQLRASIEAFTAALLAAQPSIFERPPASPSQHIAALLHMSLDQCRALLAVYDSIWSADAGWLFDSHGSEDDDDDGEDDHERGDDEDLPF